MGLESCSQGMECTAAAAAKPSKTPSNTNLVSKFAKVCKLMSIGVFPSENHYLNGGQIAEESSSNATEEAERDDEKLHPQPIIDFQRKRYECGGYLEISKLFDTFSTLKLAYVKLQEAHIPYDPDKIRAADELIVSHLESLCKIKRSHKEKQAKEMDAMSTCSALLLAEIQVQERLLHQLKSQVKLKESVVVNLRQVLEDLQTKHKNLSLVQELSKQQKQGVKVLNFLSFPEIFKAVSKAIHDFAKPLIALMKVTGWDLDHAANAVEGSVVYAKRCHKKYAFEAYISRRMFHDLSFQTSYNVDNLVNLDDPLDVLIKNPQSSFAKFCRRKYLLVVHPSMETSFFGSLDHRTFVTNGLHPQTPFYRAFVKMAKWVWILQGTAASIMPQPELFTVEKGSDFSEAYMESVLAEELKEDQNLQNLSGAGRLKVEFMILPGFKVGNTLIRSRVYLSGVGFSNPKTS